MGNDLDRNCPELASPERSWRTSITNNGFTVFLPTELMLSKGGSYLLRFATCRLRILLRVGYVSCYVSAIKRLGRPLSDTWERGWPTFALLTMVRPQPRPARSTPGEFRRFANREALAGSSYPSNSQALHNRHIRRPGFPVSTKTRPRAALRRGRHAGLLITPNCQRRSARPRHS